MIVQVSDILKDFGGKIKVEGDIPIDQTEFLGENFVFTSPISINGEIVNNGSALDFNAKCGASVLVHCARCAKEMKEDVAFSVHELLSKDDGTVSHDDDIVLFSGYSIDITDIVLNHFLMNVSARYLCSDDCKGLCLTCGADLNEGDCDCDKEVIDPRWAALKDIMNDSADSK